MGSTLAVFLSVIAFREIRARPGHPRPECYSNLRELYTSWSWFLGERQAFVTEVSTNQGGTREFNSDTSTAYLHIRALLEFVSVSPPSPVPVEGVLCPLDARRP